jgi:hypothetical protein
VTTTLFAICLQQFPSTLIKDAHIYIYIYIYQNFEERDTKKENIKSKMEESDTKEEHLRK